jgi:cell division protein FtsI (penicillin-binding protein 3)/stage V sporulation protein D (sporulation-specific penicillin-binding protein)
VDAKKRYVFIAENITEEQANALRALRDQSWIFETRMQRIYPNGIEASHVLGYVNKVQKQTALKDKIVEFEAGAFGMEQTLNQRLCGTPGERLVVRDGSRGRKEIAAYRLQEHPPHQGWDVVLTIDQTIQHYIEEEVDQIVQKYSPKSVSILVIRPSTGEVLAMANRPAFDPNDRNTMTPDTLKNVAISDIYEPGSTFKIMTLASALNERVVNLDTQIFCENGKFFYANTWLHDTHENGMLSVRDVVAKSSNIGFAKIAFAMGQDRFFHYVTAFGYGKRIQNPEVALAGEERGILRPENKWSQLSITRVPMGYEVAVTHLQMAMAASAIANNGVKMVPMFVRAIVDQNGKTVKQYLPKTVGQVIDRESATLTREALESVVSDEGTAVNAAVPGFIVGGKTGTAHKFIDGSYKNDKYIGSFIGFLPAKNPEVVISIMVNEPQGKEYYGGQVAAPAFRNIGLHVSQYLNLKPDSNTVSIAHNDELVKGL